MTSMSSDSILAIILFMKSEIFKEWKLIRESLHKFKFDK